MNALYRPGPMDYIPQFIRRKHGQEPVTYDIPVMEKYLKDTYGVTVYQEQVMLLSRLLANFTRGESDQLRKAMGKKIMAMLAELKPKFINGGKSNGHDEKVLEKIWADWEKFASYAFNKSHAACYSWVAYQTAYLKAHYPAEFMAANLTVAKDDIKDVTKFMDECKAMKISVLAPDVNESEMNFTVNNKGDVRFGLGGVKGVGEGAVEAIINERKKNGKYKDLFDFLERVNLQSCNRKTVESLALAGAFDCFDGFYREQLFTTNNKGENMLEVVMRYGNRYQQDKQAQSITLFDGFGGLGVEVQRPDLPIVPRWSSIERLNKEKELIGIFLSAHPLDEWEFEVRELCNITADELTKFESWRKPESRANATIKEELDEQTNEVRQTPNEWIQEHTDKTLHIGGIVVSSEELISQKGNPYGRYVIEDYSGSYQFSAFGETYKQYASLLKQNVYVYISGVIQQKGAHMKWFKPKPIEEAEFEFSLQQVQLIEDAQKHLNSLTLQIPIEQIQPDLIDELTEMTQQHAGLTPLRVNIFDETKQNLITFNAHPIKIDSSFYHWLKMQKLDNIFYYKVN
jgi:DNA polymerase-3 subunit alpha